MATDHRSAGAGRPARADRLPQGVAGGMLIPQNSGLVQELLQGDERVRAFGLIIGATAGIATATGPMVGGLILTAFLPTRLGQWRSR